MPSLSAELECLYGPGTARAMVLEIAAPADWRRVGEIWRHVQADLSLPAPAIAVNGTDGMQLWFALAEPAGLHPARQFLEALRRRHLADLPPPRVRAWPALDADAGEPPPVPALQPSGHWSAFVAPDLAPLFAETPWLDIPPGDDAQASLLAGLAPAEPRAFAAALAALDAAPADAAAPASSPGAPAQSQQWRDPREFLLSVMNDPQAPLALRVDAAKALLAAPSPGAR